MDKTKKNSIDINKLKRNIKLLRRAPDDVEDFAPDAPGEMNDRGPVDFESMMRKIDMLDAKLELVFVRIDELQEFQHNNNFICDSVIEMLKKQ